MRVVDCMTDDETFEELLKHIDSLRKAIASAPGVSAQAVAGGLIPFIEFFAQRAWMQQKEIAFQSTERSQRAFRTWGSRCSRSRLSGLPPR